MSTAIHGSFTINRLYDASPARLFKAFADPISKARWFAGPPGWREIERVFDFRVGGKEIAHGKFPDGPETRFVASYHEIVPSERLVYAYDMSVDGRLISVSLATVEMISQGVKTELRITEQGAFFDDQDGMTS
jgi:uncharacterized protein YndB with AHSA1/START domain